MSHLLMIGIVLTLGVASFFLGEHVPAGHGFGWDGVLYADMARHLGGMISEGSLSGYYAQRILPSAIVHSLLQLARVPLSDTNIIRGFELYNLTLLLLGCRLWWRLADGAALGQRSRWIGFAGLFLSFEGSKQAFYYPVATDVTALLIGLLLLLCYVERRPLALLATATAGAFTWVSAGLCGALLLLFLETEIRAADLEASPLESRRWMTRLRVCWTILLTGAVAGFLALVRVEAAISAEAARAWHLRSWQALLTSLPSLAGAGVALAVLLGSTKFVKAVLVSLRGIRLHLLALSLLAVGIPWIIVGAIANPMLENANTLAAVLRLCVMPPPGKFLLPVVTLAAEWGPLVLVVLLGWKEFCLEARRMGPGFVAVVGFGIPLGLVSEPRFITCVWPLVVWGAVRAIDRAVPGPSLKYAYPVVTILFAQFWLRMNKTPWPGGDTENLELLPKQLFFMHYGLWMAWWAYWLQLAMSLVCAIWLRATLQFAGSTESSALRTLAVGG